MKILKTIVATAVVVFALTTVAMAGVQHFTEQGGRTTGSQARAAQPTYTVTLSAAQLMHSSQVATSGGVHHARQAQHHAAKARRHSQAAQLHTSGHHAADATYASSTGSGGTHHHEATHHASSSGSGSHHAQTGHSGDCGDGGGSCGD